MTQQPPFTPDPQQPGQQPQYGQAQQYGQAPQYPNTGAPPAFQAAQPEPKKSWFARHKVLTGIGAAVLGIGLLSAIFGGGGGGNDAAPSVAPVASEPAEAAEQPAEEPAEEAPAEEAPAEEAPADEPTDDPAAAGIGTAVTSGDLQFVVTSVEPGGTELGEYITETAQGEYFLVHVEVTNTGKEAVTFSGSSQKLIDDQGREHESDSVASLYIPDNDVLFTSINPGNTVVGTIVFDLPADATPVTLELKGGGLFDSAAEVSLR